MYEWRLEGPEQALSSIASAGGSPLLEALLASGFEPANSLIRLGSVPHCPDDALACGQQPPDLEPELWCVHDSGVWLVTSFYEGDVQIELLTVFDNGAAAITVARTEMITQAQQADDDAMRTWQEGGIYRSVFDGGSASEMMDMHQRLVAEATAHEGPVATLSGSADVLTGARAIARLVDNHGWANGQAVSNRIHEEMRADRLTDEKLDERLSASKQRLAGILEDVHGQQDGDWQRMWTFVQPAITGMAKGSLTDPAVGALHRWLADRLGLDTLDEPGLVLSKPVWKAFVGQVMERAVWPDREALREEAMHGVAARTFDMLFERRAKRMRALYTERVPLAELTLRPTLPSTRGDSLTRWRNWTDDERETTDAQLAASKRGEFDPQMHREHAEVKLEAMLAAKGIEDANEHDKAAWIEANIDMSRGDEIDREAIERQMAVGKRLGVYPSAEA